MTPVVGLSAGDLAHGIVDGMAKEVDVEAAPPENFPPLARAGRTFRPVRAAGRLLKAESRCQINCQ